MLLALLIASQTLPILCATGFLSFWLWMTSKIGSERESVSAELMGWSIVGILFSILFIFLGRVTA